MIGALHYIVIGLAPAEVRLTVRGFGAFIRFVQAPILAIQIQMIITRPPIGLAHRPKRFSAEYFAHHCIKIPIRRRSFAWPGVVLAGADIKSLEFLRPFVFKQWILQLTGPVLAPEKHPEGVFNEIRVAAKSSSYSQAAILLKSSRNRIGRID